MTNNLGAPRIADGQADGQWATANDMTGRLDGALSNPLTILVDDSNTLTLTALQFTSNATFILEPDSPPADAEVTMFVPDENADLTPLVRGNFNIINNLAETVRPQVSGQPETAPTLSAGQRSIFAMDGTNVYVVVPSGTIGADGADGTDPGILFTFSTTTTDSDPGSGILRANNASLASATFLYIDDLDRSGNNVEAHLLTWDDSTNTPKGHLYLSRASDGAQAHFIVGAVTDASGYVKLAVTYESGATSFANADAISAQFYRAGDAGAGAGATLVQTHNLASGSPTTLETTGLGGYSTIHLVMVNASKTGGASDIIQCGDSGGYDTTNLYLRTFVNAATDTTNLGDGFLGAANAASPNAYWVSTVNNFNIAAPAIHHGSEQFTANPFIVGGQSVNAKVYDRIKVIAGGGGAWSAGTLYVIGQ